MRFQDPEAETSENQKVKHLRVNKPPSNALCKTNIKTVNKAYFSRLNYFVV